MAADYSRPPRRRQVRARPGCISASGQTLPCAGPEPEFANTEAAANTEAEKTASRRGRVVRRPGAGLVLGFPAPPRSGSALRFRQDCRICRMIGSRCMALPLTAPAPWRGCFRYGESRSFGAREFPTFSKTPKLPGAEATGGVWRGAGHSPAKTNQEPCGRVPLDAAKQTGAPPRSGRALCFFPTRSMAAA